MKKAPKTKRASSTKDTKRAGKMPTRGTKSAARKPAARSMSARRADFGAPIDGFFAKQPPELRTILVELRRLVEEVAPEASASIKWGMPFYSIGRNMMCALGGHKSHVNLILAGPPGTFVDPRGRLEGEGKTGRRLTLRSIDELPRAAVRGWIRAAVEVARAKA